MTKEEIIKALREMARYPTVTLPRDSEALKAAADLLAQPEQEPVAFINVEKQKLEWAKLTSWHTPTIVNLPKIPLYTSPPQRQWVGLTVEEIADIAADVYGAAHCDDVTFATKLQNKLKGKNETQ